MADRQVEFREVVGRSGYLVGSDGHVYSTKLWRGSAFRRLAEGRDQDGYPTVQLGRGKGGGRRTDQIAVHRLVAGAFLPPRPHGHEVCHFDGDKTNNTSENLRWGTPKDNAADRERHGRTRRGSANSQAKLTEDDVVEIRRRRSAGETLASLAAEYGVSIGAVWFVQSGRNWRQV